MRTFTQTALQRPLLWLWAARLGWLLITGATATLLMVSLFTNAWLWWHATEADCLEAACVADFRGMLTVFGSPHRVAAFFALGQGVEMVPWVLAGVLIFWRKGREPFALAFSLMLSLTGVFVSEDITRLIITNNYPAWVWLVHALETLGSISLWLFYCFPDGRFVVRPLRWIAVAWISLVLLANYTPFDFNRLTAPLPTLVRIGFALSVALALLMRYRRMSGATERQQIKWLVASVTLAALMYVIGLIVFPLRTPGMTNALINLYFVPFYYLSWGMVPVALGVAILRYRLWEIDVILRKTLLYSTLTGLLALVYGGSVLTLQGLFGAYLRGQANTLVNVMSTLVIAALFGPLRRRAQTTLDRRFFRRTYDSAQIAASFAAGVRDEVALEQLRERLETAVQSTVQPQQVWVWLRAAPAREAAPRSAAQTD